MRSKHRKREVKTSLVLFADMREELGTGTEDTSQDNVITASINAATEFCEAFVGFFLLKSEVDEFFSGFDYVAGLELYTRSSVSGPRVTYKGVNGGNITLPSDSYILDDTGRNKSVRIKTELAGGAISYNVNPDYQNPVKVHYEMAEYEGFGIEGIQSAIKILVRAYYNNTSLEADPVRLQEAQRSARMYMAPARDFYA